MSRVLIGNIKGPKGDAATIGVGDVTTVAPGTGATVTNSGTSDAAILDFRIPKGDKGDPGDPGVNDYASSSAAGLVRVGDDVAVDSSSGILSLNSTNITEASSVSNINSGDSYRTILGKLKKFISTLMPSNFLINTVNSNAADKGLTANMGNKLAGDIATVQTSNTATRNFAVGEYIVYNGIMYKVTTAIASGGTLTPGTNLTATNAGAQLKSLNDSLTSLDSKYSTYHNDSFSKIAYYQSPFNFRKFGGWVEMSYAGSSAEQSAQSDYAELFTLTNAYKPKGAVYVQMIAEDSNGIGDAVLQINPSGIVKTYNFNTAVPAGKQYRVHVTYMALDFT